MWKDGRIERAAAVVHQGFEAYARDFQSITGRVQSRFEARDWPAIRRLTIERLDLHPRAVRLSLVELRYLLGADLGDRSTWIALKRAFSDATLGRDDLELAQTFFNSLVRRACPHDGVDPEIDFVRRDFPLPYHGFEMACARMYAVRTVDERLVRRILEHAGFGVPFADLEADARLAAERLAGALPAAVGGGDIDAVDVLRPIFFRNKGAYLIGRARRAGRNMPILLAIDHLPEGLRVDALLTTEDEASVVFSFARWYFHVAVRSPREIMFFLHTIMPRKRRSELYVSLGFTKHGKTEFYTDLMRTIGATRDRFVYAEGQAGLVMVVFTLPSFEFVFKVIRDRFGPSKKFDRRHVMEQYRSVLRHDRVGRLVDFQEFEGLSFDRVRFSDDLLAELVSEARQSVMVSGERVSIRHCYVERRVRPLDVFLRGVPREMALAVVDDLGRAIRDLCAENIFPGDMLLKNFGVTRHGRVVFYDYDEIGPLLSYRFRRIPPARTMEDELSDQPWFRVGEKDVFPEEMRSFLGLPPHLKRAFEELHGDLLEVSWWRAMQERIRAGEVITFRPYGEGARLRPDGGR